MNEKNTFITNTVKCRPPGNRNPLSDERAECKGFLNRQIKAAKPKVVVLVGAVAMKNILNTTKTIGQRRGCRIVKKHVTYVPVYHPAYCLRQPSARKVLLKDLRKAKALYDLLVI